MDADVPRLADLLARHRGRAVCSTCLAAELAIPVGRVRDALGLLGGAVTLYRGFGICSLCARSSVVTALASEEERPPVEVVQSLFVEIEFGLLCQLCVSRHTGLSFAGVQKALWHLRIQLDLKRRVAACTICGRTRIVTGRSDSPPATNERDPSGWPICPRCSTSVRPSEAVARAGDAMVHRTCPAQERQT